MSSVTHRISHTSKWDSISIHSGPGPGLGTAVWHVWWVLLVESGDQHRVSNYPPMSSANLSPPVSCLCGTHPETPSWAPGDTSILLHSMPVLGWQQVLFYSLLCNVFLYSGSWRKDKNMQILGISAPQTDTHLKEGPHQGQGTGRSANFL